MLEKGKCFVILLAVMAGLSGGILADGLYLHGDANGDAVLSMADAVYSLRYLFANGEVPGCMSAADFNNDRSIDLSDSIGMLVCLSEEDQSPFVSDPWLGCNTVLSRAPLVDDGAAISLGEASKDGDQVVVPVHVWGRTGLLMAWRMKIMYPADALALTDFVVPCLTEEEPDFKSNFQIQSSGSPALEAQILSVVYNIIMREDHFCPIADGTKIADLVFSIKGAEVDVADITMSSAYGDSELVLGPEATFPLVAGGKALLAGPIPAGTTGLTASNDDGTVSLAWTNGQAYDKVLVERNGALVATLPGNAASYTDIPPSDAFGYRVRGKVDGMASPGAFAFIRNFTVAEPVDASVRLRDMTRELAWTNGDAYDAVVLSRNGEVIATLPGDAESYLDEDPDGAVSVYSVFGESGAGRSVRVPMFPNSMPTAGDGVDNLSCRFLEDGTFQLSWDPQEGADRYEIERDFSIIGEVDAGETSFTDAPDLLNLQGRYLVISYTGESMLGWSSCFADRASPVAHLSARFDEDLQAVEFSWQNSGTYLAVIVYCDDEPLAMLPGDAESYSYVFPADDEGAPKTFSIQGVGETFVTRPANLTLNDPSLQTSNFLRGDANSDGTVSIADMTLIRRYLFLGQVPPGCMDAADANDDGTINIADAIIILSTLYMGDSMQPQIFPEPYPIPGFDLTGDEYWCDSVTIVPGEETTDLLTIGEVEAGVGQDVLIPVYLTHEEPIEAFQFVIQYNPAQFTPYPSSPGTPSAVAGLDFTRSIMVAETGEDIDFSALFINEEEGYMVIAALQSIIYDQPIPAGENQLLVELRGRISDDVEVGDTITLTPYNGESDEGVGIHHLRNEITGTGEARYVSFYPRTKGGAIRIKDNPLTMDFIRGDANCDGLLNLADPIFTLNYLFHVGGKPACADAADANDDGTLDLGDPIHVLDFLFGEAPKSGPGSIFTSFGGCHPDLTSDNLNSCYYEFCPRN